MSSQIDQVVNDTTCVCTQINWIFFLENPLVPGHRVCLLIFSQYIKLPLVDYEGILKSPPASSCLIHHISHYWWSEKTCVLCAITWCTGLSLPQLDSSLILTPTVIAHPSSGHSLGARVYFLHSLRPPQASSPQPHSPSSSTFEDQASLVTFIVSFSQFSSSVSCEEELQEEPVWALSLPLNQETSAVLITGGSEVTAHFHCSINDNDLSQVT